MLLNFYNFLNEDNKKENTKINIEDNKYDFFYSNDFGQKLLKINNPISKDIMLSYNMKTNMTCLDVTNNIDYISYLDSKDASKIDENDGDLWNNNKRKIIRIGKFINKFFDNKYDNETIEDFVSTYKSIVKEDKIYFKIYKGEDIPKWYDENNTLQSGSLGDSCMKYERCQNYLDLYEENPEKIKLLVLFERDKDYAIGRSLLWTLNNGNIFMDRIYTSDDHDVKIFKRYAKDNDILLNKNNDPIYGVKDIFTYLKPKYYDNYPYLDTLFLYQPDTGLITDNIKFCNMDEEILILDDVFGSGRLYEK